MDHRIHDICYAGKLAQLENLLVELGNGSGGNGGGGGGAALLDARDRAGDTPLHLAALGGHLRVVARLLQECPQLCDARDKQGWTPLHYAASTGNSGVAAALLDAGARVTQDKDGNTPVHEAAAKVGPLADSRCRYSAAQPPHSPAALFRAALQCRVTPDAVSSSWSAQLRRRYDGCLRISSHLSETRCAFWGRSDEEIPASGHGPRPRMRNGPGDRGGGEQLLRGDSADVGLEPGYPAHSGAGPFTAAGDSSSSCSCSCSCSCCSSSSSSSCSCSCCSGCSSSPSSPSSTSSSPSSVSAAAGRRRPPPPLLLPPVCVGKFSRYHGSERDVLTTGQMALVDHGAPIEARSNSGWTALLHAASAGRGAVVSLLCQRGASVDARDRVGETALHKACTKDVPNCVRALVDAGADVRRCVAALASAVTSTIVVCGGSGGGGVDIQAGTGA
jgi:hypothetical protein